MLSGAISAALADTAWAGLTGDADYGEALYESCSLPDYDYSAALKSAKWDARGPETTMMFGKIRAMGVNIFDEGAPGSDTVKMLVAAFAKFAIPYQIRVPPSAASSRGGTRRSRRNRTCCHACGPCRTGTRKPTRPSG